MLCVVGTLVGLSQESRKVREINAEKSANSRARRLAPGRQVVVTIKETRAACPRLGRAGCLK